MRNLNGAAAAIRHTIQTALQRFDERFKRCGVDSTSYLNGAPAIRRAI
jgi:hypothetical protein